METPLNPIIEQYVVSDKPSIVRAIIQQRRKRGDHDADKHPIQVDLDGLSLIDVDHYTTRLPSFWDEVVAAFKSFRSYFGPKAS